MEQLIRNKTAVVISDLHVGDPDIDPEVKKRGLDDFDRDEDFVRLLRDVIPRRVGDSTTLILNGDFIDFIQILPELGRHSAGDRFGATENHSRLKLQQAIKGHPPIFDSLATFLANGGQLLVMPGNHDIDFYWPGVFADLRERLGSVPEPMLRFVREGAINEQRVYIEHGNQYSYDNRFEFWSNPILDAPDDRRRLERPWGTLFLDMVYNDIKDLYPFSNKVYPHAQLAWIALRSFKDDKNVSPKAIARLMVFFSSKGKRFLWEHFLGETPKDEPVPIDDLWKRLPVLDANRRTEILAEIEALIGAEKGSSKTNQSVSLNSNADRARPTQSVMLGRTDNWGMSKRQADLLRSGKVDLVAFGHTHKPVDGNKFPPYGTADKRRGFNTGSWVPSIPIGNFEKPKWRDLGTKPSIADVHYLIIDLKPYPTGSLEPLLPPDKTVA